MHCSTPWSTYIQSFSLIGGVSRKQKKKKKKKKRNGQTDGRTDGCFLPWILLFSRDASLPSSFTFLQNVQ